MEVLLCSSHRHLCLAQGLLCRTMSIGGLVIILAQLVCARFEIAGKNFVRAFFGLALGAECRFAPEQAKQVTK